MNAFWLSPASALPKEIGELVSPEKLMNTDE
jgi:hypothetical protein